MRAHVGKVVEILDSHKFDSFTYLSSTRVYENGRSGDESSPLTADPSAIHDFYKISKIAGEAVCMANPSANVRVVRLSNVLGMERPPLTFVPSIISDALNSGSILMESAPESAKDYISMKDVVKMLPRIAMEGRHRIYNLASGRQHTHKEITDVICSVLGCSIQVKKDAPRASFPEISIARLVSDFDFQPQPVLKLVQELCLNYQAEGLR